MTERNTPILPQIKNIPLNKLNLTFSLKHYDATKENHDSKIRILKNKNTWYKTIIDGYFFDNLISNIVQCSQFNGYYKESFKEGITKSNVRSLKTLVNYKMREAIGSSLEYNDISKNFDTAFYVLYYSSVNRVMKQVTTELLKNYVGA